MSKIDRFEDLECWQDARELVKTVFLLSESGKLQIDRDTKSQLRRAALSTMNNIAEGFARYNNKEFIRFLDFSQSSSSEVKSMLYVLQDLDYLPHNEIENLHSMVDKTRHKTLALVRYLKSSTLKH